MERQQNRVYIFDTTLRDGEQAAGGNLNVAEKLQIARQLSRLGVDVIEAGFPAASPGDFACVEAIAREVKDSVVAGLSRTKKEDIRACFEAVKSAPRRRIHTFIATSPIHMEHKLQMKPDEVLEEIRSAVSLACGLVEDVEFSAEDASRSELPFLIEAFKTAAAAGASTLNIPDTVGYATPDEFYEFCQAIIKGVDAPKAVYSVHCHNDLGLAVANSLAAVRAGVRQVECTINGLGERAGNASLEEVVMALKTRADRYGFVTGLDSTKLHPTSALVSRLSGVHVPPNKAIVGANAFAHQAGIHQHGVMKNPLTYEIMNPEEVGASGSELVLGKHSGRHAFRDRIEQMGYVLTPDQIETAFTLFKKLCDSKKNVSDGDIAALIADEILPASGEGLYELKHCSVKTGNGPTLAVVTLANGKGDISDAATGNGPIDAAYRAIWRVIDLEPELLSFNIKATSDRSDSLGETTVLLRSGDVTAPGRGVSTDVIESAVKAFVNGVNRLHVLASAKGVELSVKKHKHHYE
ncbi:MAG: 2-isopropylmalate synthase [Synergistaceae bacterium]|jgi:2-isopropylmalate synthase|nr:2-isopropylmalate synthase [Synergistaceae bacterium]